MYVVLVSIWDFFSVCRSVTSEFLAVNCTSLLWQNTCCEGRHSFEHLLNV